MPELINFHSIILKSTLIDTLQKPSHPVCVVWRLYRAQSGLDIPVSGAEN
jgi:hypothetical protein